MKAVVIDRYGDVEVLKIREIDEPIPGRQQVRIRLYAAGVNPVDTYLRAGSQGYTVEFPFIPGINGAGEVDMVGDGVEGVSPGDRVYVTRTLTGSYGEKCLCSPDQIFPLSQALSWEEGACLGVTYFSAWRGLVHHGRAKSGQTVLIHGATGGVGCASVQLAKFLDLKIFGTFGSAGGEDVIRSLGVEEAFDHRDPGRFEAIMEATGRRGVDIILEMLANESLDGDLKILNPRGRVIIIGSRGSIPITPRDLMESEASIIGMKLFKASEQEMVEAAAAIAEATDRGQVRPVIAKVFPLEQVSNAHRAVFARGHRGSIVLQIR